MGALKTNNMNKYKLFIDVILQKNINQNNVEEISKYCNSRNVPLNLVDYIPFSNEFPEISCSEFSIFYGSTNFIEAATKKFGKHNGIFTNENFNMQNYADHYGKHMINYGSEILQMAEVLKKEDSDKEYFFRPNDDNKLFDGTVKSLSKIKAFLRQLIDNDLATDTIKMLFGIPYGIKREWRIFVVDGEIVTSSLYRENFNLKTSSEEKDNPKEMLKFAKEMIALYKPHDNFVIDICESGGEYYILELGSLNSCGFYKADISKIFEALVRYMFSIKFVDF